MKNELSKMNTLLSQWISEKYLKNAFLINAQNIFCKGKPFSHIVLHDFFVKEKINALSSALKQIKYEEKYSDLFSFLQSADLKTIADPLIEEFVSFYTSEVFCNYVQKLCKDHSLVDADLSAFIYREGDYLLPHDDRLEKRKIAYVINLSTHFSKKDGGRLQFFNSKKEQINEQRKGQRKVVPTKIVKSFIPTYNTLFLFRVSEKSFHQVEEVMSRKQRRSIGGWFHAKRL